ncbi:hypothetical protein WR25_11320 [Diploscapter pachys]|uniref:Major facilitator superfamily (MFS) profile domain-containing protein n=1 Tax=Diploscapter pachys TaxID=2018661 RepID=A0A2A2JIJ2_9BILA|nr:hypothetical protein WR25_11320 [Diploscapter pachys]
MGLLERLNFRRSSDSDGEEKMCCGIVNAEPVIFLMAICVGFIGTFEPSFMYYARCIEIANSTEYQSITQGENATEICASITGSNSTLLDIIEKDIASAKTWLQILSSIPTIITAPLIGIWADKNGRKPALIFSLIAYVIYSILHLMATLTYQTISIYIWYFVSEVAIGFVGGTGAAYFLTLSMVTDDCRHKLKPGCSTVPIRIGVASFLQILGAIIGNFGVEILSVDSKANIESHTMSYIRCSFIQASIAFVGLMYAFLYVKETHFPKREGFGYTEFQNSNLDLSSENGDDAESVEVRQSPPRRAGPLKHVGSLVEVLTEQRPGFTRLCLCLSLFFVFVEFLALDTNILFLLVKRAPFAWSDKIWSIFLLVKTSVFGAGMIVCPLLLTLVHWLGKDSLMIIISIAASAASFFLISQATTTEEIFIMVHVIMTICPIISTAIFNNVFSLTLGTWPGFVFFLGGILQTIVVFGQIIVHILMRPQWRMEKMLREHRKNEIVAENDDPREEHRIVEADPEQRSVSNTTVMGSDIQVSQENSSGTPRQGILKV